MSIVLLGMAQREAEQSSTISLSTGFTLYHNLLTSTESEG